MAGKDFSEYVQGKTFDEILHEGRRESADRILSEALTPLALLLSRELLKVLLISPQALEELSLSAVPSTSRRVEPFDPSTSSGHRSAQDRSVEASGRRPQASTQNRTGRQEANWPVKRC